MFGMPAMLEVTGSVRSTMRDMNSAPLLGVTVVPGQDTVLDQEEQPVEDIPEHGEGQHAGKHLADLEAALGAQDEIADAARGRDHFADHHDDQRYGEAHAHAGEDIR